MIAWGAPVGWVIHPSYGRFKGWVNHPSYGPLSRGAVLKNLALAETFFRSTEKTFGAAALPVLVLRHSDASGDPAARKVLWPAIGWPGAVLVDGEIAAAWRTRAKGKHLTLEVEPFTTLTAKTRKAIADESTIVAASRGAADLAIAYLR